MGRMEHHEQSIAELSSPRLDEVNVESGPATSTCFGEFWSFCRLLASGH